MTSPSAPNQQIHQFEWSPDWEGRRLAEVLKDLLPGLSSRDRVLVVVNGLASAGGETLTNLDSPIPAGTALRIDLRHGAKGERAPKKARLADQFRVVHDDEHCVVVEKAAGILVNPTDDERTRDATPPLVELLKHYWKAKGTTVVNPVLVHRLDRDTSGLMVLAKTPHAAKALQRQAAGHFMERRYVAVVEGRVRGDRGTWRSFFGVGADGLKKSIAPAIDADAADQPHPEGAKLAITHWSVRERFGVATLIDLRLETGRTHQIRIHCAEAGHPVIGDRVYTSLAGKTFPKFRFGHLTPLPERMMLHAVRLKFQHPGPGERWLNFSCAEPESFIAYAREVRRGAGRKDASKRKSPGR